MEERPLMGGEKVAVNEDYVLESIWYPAKKVVEGYGPVSKMNSFKGKLTQDDINQVIAYLKYLNNPADVAGGDVVDGLRADGGDVGDTGQVTQENTTDQAAPAAEESSDESNSDESNSDEATDSEDSTQEET
jgi:hypothetical protein